MTEEVPAPDNPRYRVLYVDDDPALARLVQRGLARKGIAVTLVHDARSAVARLQQQPAAYHAAIVDYALPGTRGTRLASELCAIHRELATVLVSGHSDRIDLEHLWREGISEYLPKPFTLSSLAAAIDRAVQRLRA